MADAYSQVSPEVKARQKALLSTIATGGTRGLQSFEQAEQAVNEQRKNALGRANSIAGIIGGPESQGFEKIPEQQYGSRLADIAQSRSNFTQDLARRGIAGQSALSGLEKISPLLQQQTQSKLATAAKTALQKDWEKKALGQAEMDESTATENQKKGQTELDQLNGQLSGIQNQIDTNQKAIDSINDRRKKLTDEWRGADAKNIAEQVAGKTPLGHGRNKQEIEADLQATAQNRHKLIQANGRLTGDLATQKGQLQPRIDAVTKTLAEQGKITPETRSERARGIATSQLGIAPELATGGLGPEDVNPARLGTKDEQSLAAKARIPLTGLTQVRQDPAYATVEQHLPQWRKGGMTLEQFDNALQTDDSMYNEDGSFKDSVYRLIMAEVGSTLPTVGETNRRKKFEEG